MQSTKSLESAVNEEMRRSLSSRSIWRNSFGPWRMNQVNLQRQQNLSGLLPSLNRKLSGKEYSSFSHAVEAAQIEEWHLGEEQREIVDKKASRKRASQRAREGSPGENSKPKV